MKAECTVLREIDYYKECIELLFRIVNNNTYENLKKDMLKRIEIERHSKVVSQLDKLNEIQEDVKKNVDLTNADIQLYFKSFALDNLCLAKILYQSIVHCNFSGDLKEMKNYIKQSFENIKNDNTLELNLVSSEIETSKYDENQRVSFLDRIAALECSFAQKWQLLELIEHSNEHLDRLFYILDNTIKKVKKHEEVLEELKRDSCDYWEEYFKQNEFVQLACRIYNIKEDSYQDKPAFIRPQIMSCDWVIFWGNDENAGDYHLFDVGITIDSEFRVTKNSLTKEQVCNGLKLLSDPSKFEILRYIKEKKAYGQEIAAELGLTTATISHHMNALMLQGLINIEKVDNRVYYQVNKDAINKLLEEAKHALL
jgi:DNA-binding transcriptional ArsR family regulator